MEPVTTLLKPTIDLARMVSQRIRRVRVRSHIAYFVSNPESGRHMFVTVANVGSRAISITHVWLATEPQLAVIQPRRPLDKKLGLDEVWETWFPLANLTGRPEANLPDDDLLRLARVRLSTGRVIKARPDRKVPPAGEVPGRE
jgi:hypothetical protein